jgi:hypothetical protein
VDLTRLEEILIITESTTLRQEEKEKKGKKANVPTKPR